MKRFSIKIWEKASGVLALFRPVFYIFYLLRNGLLGVLECWHLAANEGLKIRMKECRQGVILHGCARITGVRELRVGDNVHIGRNCFIRCEGGVDIGSNTHISRNFILYSIQHNSEGTKLPYDSEKIGNSVKIGRNVWIGMNVSVLPGVSIGDGAIVGMGTTVASDIAPMQIVVGQRFRELGYRDREHYLKLEEDKAFGGPSGY